MKKILLVAVAVVLVGCRGDGLLSPDVLTYSATSRIVPYPYSTNAAPSVEISLLIRNDTERPITFNFSRDFCDGLELRAFVTPSLSGSPVWNSASVTTCALIAYGPSTLEAGDSVRVDAYEPVREILGANLPTGTYYFDVLQHIGGGDIRETSVHIPAGSVELAR